MESLTPQSTNFSEWYNQVITLSDLADKSPTKGCIIIKPYGYAIWEKIQSILDQKLKHIGYQNAYFPMFIPQSYLSKESEHIQGFAKECAVVTHTKLKTDNGGIILDSNSKLEEPYIIRPTSETIIWHTYKRWIHSYRDLPLKINQWCNVCRWEMRTRPFLRTSEFLWQEGHSAYEDYTSAKNDTINILKLYRDFGKEYLSIPFIQGKKTLMEKFAGAEQTYTLEALMKDGKALQCFTSHLLSQNFSRAFDVKFLDKNNELQYAYGISYGISTRIIGALIMLHGDDHGLILPPKIAPIQVVIIPIYSNIQELNMIKDYIMPYLDILHSLNISYHIDDREYFHPGYKYHHWEIKGVPVQIRIGEKDIKNNTVEIFRRDTMSKTTISNDNLPQTIIDTLSIIQDNIYANALHFTQENTFHVDDYDAFKDKILHNKGFISYPYNPEEEEKIKTETSATVRCQVIDDNGEILDTKRALFSQSY